MLLAHGQSRRGISGVFTPAVAVLMSLLACDEGTERRDGVGRALVDTLGDTVVVRTVDAPDSAAALSLVREVAIGVVDGDEAYQFASIDEIVETPGGGVLIWDNVLGVLRQFDSRGTFVRQIGRQGSGPGEYRSSNGVAILGDRLLLWDARQGRMNVYDTAGVFVTSWHAMSPAQGPRGLHTDTLGRLYLRGPVMAPRPPDSLAHPNAQLVEFDATSGAAVRSIAVPAAPLPPRVAVMQDGVPRVFMQLPLSPAASWAWSPLGHVVSSSGEGYAIILHREDRLVRIERDVPPVRAEADERAYHEERVTAVMRRADPSWRWSGPPVPEYKPFIRGLRVGADGRIWVQRYFRGERVTESELDARTRPGIPAMRWREPVGYDLFDPDGRFVGTLRVPAGVTVRYSDGDRVWATVRDSLDVPQAVRFRLIRGAAGGP